MKKIAIVVISILLLLDLACLIVFGNSYTKLLLLPPFFFAHDVLLFVLTVGSIWFINKDNRIKSVEIVFVLAIIYLIISFFRLGFDFDRSYLLIRQFMIFGYGLSIYIILNSLFGDMLVKKNSVKAIIYFGFLCITIQVVYVLYLFVFRASDVFFERNYFSPITILGFFVAGSYILVNVKGKLLKNALFLLVFLMSFSVGHDSTYLSLALIYFAYLFIKSSKKYKIILSSFLLIVVIAVFVFIPSFTDINVQWRLMFWKDSLLRIANNYFIFGDGFGIPYASDETISKLNELFPDTLHSPRIIGNEKYFSAPHNSFLSMAIHIGILSLILLFYPIKTIFCNKTLIMDKEILFLSLSLSGIVIFSSFNVVLELPHSSSIFWIVFFGLIFKLSEKSELPTNKKEL